MAIDFYALWNSSNNNNTTESLLFILFTIIIASWLYLFIISFKSYLLVPMIQPKQERTKFLSSSYLTKESTITSIYDNIHYFSKKKRFTNDSSIYSFVSVIVPARNEQDHIKRCLLSLLAQNYPNFEVIAIDDSSTDNTLKIMRDREKSITEKQT
jgi:cellulose synthase/poly-beta-1,6-N-acetylglucosamine synthase-like glycosyltransferase